MNELMMLGMERDRRKRLFGEARVKRLRKSPREGRGDKGGRLTAFARVPKRAASRLRAALTPARNGAKRRYENV